MVLDPLAQRSLKTGWRWLRWRGAFLVLVFGLGLGAFLCGAEVSERPELCNAGILAKIYYTLGLFVLGGLDLGTPSGGPVFAQWTLWGVYFLAPAITTSALVEGLFRAFGSDALHLRRARDHTILLGTGRLARLYMMRLRSQSATHRVVVVDPNLEPSADLAFRADPSTRVVRTNLVYEDALETLRIHKARRIVLLAEDDFVNLDVATRILQVAPDLCGRVIAHISNIRLERAMHNAPILEGCEFFNSHRIAATHLVHETLLQHFAQTEPRDTVVLAGFGRLGQTVLDELQQHALQAVHSVIILDLHAKQRASTFEEQIGFHPDITTHVWDDDLQDPNTWTKLCDRIPAELEPTFLLATGDDRTNIQASFFLSRRFPNARIITRCLKPSAFAQHLAGAYGFHVFDEASLMKASIPSSWLVRPSDA